MTGEEKPPHRKQIRSALGIMGIAILFYFGSYIVSREALSLKMAPLGAPPAPLDFGPARSLLPDSALAVLDSIYAPITPVDERWSEKRISFKRVYGRDKKSGQMFGL